MANDVFGGASEQKMHEAAAAVCPDDDEVCLPHFGGFKDLVARMAFGHELDKIGAIIFGGELVKGLFGFFF